MNPVEKRFTVYDKVIRVPAKKYVYFQIFKTCHLNQENHSVDFHFEVLQTPVRPNDPNFVYDVKCYLMTEEEFIAWLVGSQARSFSQPTPQTFVPPKTTVYSSGKKGYGSTALQVHAPLNLYCIIDNTFSNFTAKSAKVTLREEWSENLFPTTILTTTPPDDTSLRAFLEEMISNSSETLHITSPYIDMSLIRQLIAKNKQGIEIRIITRTLAELQKTKVGKQAFDTLQKEFGQNHRVNDYIHSRIAISDSKEALISSADLTNDSLVSQFNLGIRISDKLLIGNLRFYFENVWGKSSSLNPREPRRA